MSACKCDRTAFTDRPDLRLFYNLEIHLNLNNSGVHSSFARFELYLSTEDQS